MPELPDLTIFADNLQAGLVGRRVADVYCGAGMRSNVPPPQLQSALVGGVIAHIERWGKEIRIQFDNRHALLIHLMLTGGFALGAKKPSTAAVQMALIFGDGASLQVEDPKAMARFALDPELGDLVPDALEVNQAMLAEMIRRKPRALIKALLIDQKIVRGIGNAYVDEILWQARISPKSVAGKLPHEAVAALAAAVPAVLNDAITELRRRHPTMIAGEFREFLSVHNPSRKQSPTGQTIRVETVASKKTYFTDEQTLYN